ncbi:hypothetical protein Vadar_028512 [Vaccinium darrowii]|uniref:Uncharacterized protein n=1 Tax=Vaccinium darrowii TaxID=229202 RepID=A0ACB7ZED1_9ERIC|nr:hypothetical protein Vadar_028512 [Vaccinium darrowii]
MRTYARMQQQIEAMTQQMATLSAAFQQQQSPTRNSFAREDDNGGFEDEYENPFAVDRPQRRGPVAQANSRRWELGFKLDIPKFKGYLQPEEFLDWVAAVEETLDFKELVARNDLAEAEDQLVSRYIGGLRQQFQDALNFFDPISVSEAHQKALNLEKQLNRRSGSAVIFQGSNGGRANTSTPSRNQIPPITNGKGTTTGSKNHTIAGSSQTKCLSVER